MKYLPLILGFLAISPSASAYLDPGTGSLIAQMAAAAFFGSLFFFKSMWRGFFGVFKGNQRSDDSLLKEDERK